MRLFKSAKPIVVLMVLTSLDVLHASVAVYFVPLWDLLIYFICGRASAPNGTAKCPMKILQFADTFVHPWEFEEGCHFFSRGLPIIVRTAVRSHALSRPHYHDERSIQSYLCDVNKNGRIDLFPAFSNNYHIVPEILKCQKKG